jgi:hypothetical protein
LPPGNPFRAACAPVRTGPAFVQKFLDRLSQGDGIAAEDQNIQRLAIGGSRRRCASDRRGSRALMSAFHCSLLAPLGPVAVSARTSDLPVIGSDMRSLGFWLFRLSGPGGVSANRDDLSRSHSPVRSKIHREGSRRCPIIGGAEALVIFQFDLLHVDGEDPSSLPLVERKTS